MAKELSCYTINAESCIECGACRRYCPVDGCITFLDDYQHKINLDVCIACGICEAFCPVPGTILPTEKEASTRPPQVLKRQRQIVWRMRWHYENHPLVGPIWRRREFET